MKTNFLHIRCIFAVTLILLMNGSAFGCSAPIANQDVNNVPTPELVDVRSNNVFIKIIASPKRDDINSGITISEIKSFDKNGNPTLAENYYSFLILNHSSEAIKFIDIGFNIQIFEYFPDSKEVIWRKVDLPYTPEKTAKILPPKLEIFDFQLINSWSFFKDQDFVNIESEIIRAYISGIGMQTEIPYHAFIDIKIR